MRFPVLALVLAACVAAPPDPSGARDGWSEAALPFGDGHDHADPAHHEGLSTPNFEVLGSTPIVSDHYGEVGGGYLCGDAQELEGGRRLAVVESRSDVGFAVLDVTVPAAPRVLGELVMPHTYIYDVAVVLDGKHVVLATAGTENLPVLPLWRDACGERPVRAREPDLLPRPMDLVLVDISDPSSPAIVDDQPLAGYGHSIFPAVVDGMQVLLVTTAGGPQSAVGAPVQTSGTFLYEVMDTAAGGRLRLISSYFQPDGSGLPLGPRGHDGWIHEHPGTGQTLAYLAGASRFTVLDLDDPAAPAEIGRWDVPVADSFLHGAFPLPELWDGRHYTVVGPEYCGHPEHTPTGVAFVLDTTDPTAPFAVAAWTLPHDVEWDGCYMFSNHYFTAVGDTLFMSLYHGGIWAIDLAPVRDLRPGDPLLSLPSIGVFLPADASLPPPAHPVRWAPTIEEVLAMPDGTLVTFDGNYGLYTLAFDAAAPAPAPPPWPLG